MNKKLQRLVIHFSGWAVFLGFPFFLLPESSLTSVSQQGNASALPLLLLKNGLLILFFYLNLFLLLPRLYDRQKKATYFLMVVLFLPMAVYLFSFCSTGLMLSKTGAGNTANTGRLVGLLQFLISWLLSCIIHLVKNYKLAMQKNKELTVQKLQAELAYLRATIKPHFLFNTLNNIYALSVSRDERTSGAVLKLSSIMRYVTEDSDSATVPLQKELDYLENYISLQELRSNDKLKVIFEITGDVGDNIIAPMLLINFIENAFKYGSSNHQHSEIDIRITVSASLLTLSVRNNIMRKN